MLEVLNQYRNLDALGILIRVIIALICASLLGLERSSKNRPAGLSTHIMVILGAMAASLTGHYIFLVKGIGTDVTRLGAQVIAGLGFLGAGTILLTNNKTVKGLTTEAGLWTTGIIGLAIGAGYYEGAVICIILVFLAEMYMGRFTKLFKKNTDVLLAVYYSDAKALDRVMKICTGHGNKVFRVNVKKNESGKIHALYTAVIKLHMPLHGNKEALFENIRKTDGVIKAECRQGKNR